MSDLGQFHRIDNIRETWAHEAYDFTPWLSDNISLLSKALGLGREGLIVEGIEVPVGAYSADVVCKDTTKEIDETVLIENQYGRSDHDHLGKTITYASGLSAATIVLICEKLREEHRTALTWLNTITNDTHNFFAVELELWRINDSPVAPKFNVVVKPDNWARIAENTKRTTEKGELSETKKLYLGYWGALREYIITISDLIESTSLRPRKPLPQMWTGFSIGKSGVELNAFINKRDKWIRADLTMHGANAVSWLEQLSEDAELVERELGFPLEWKKLNGTEQRISVTKSFDPSDKANWGVQHEWLYNKLNAMHRVFSNRIKRL
ncbi:MAG: DUF4268 domain-containing protein [Rhodobacteraceae bacterium]|nr:DUF4268 domain-containing protein [Paracoccaceae bacterium]